MKVWVVDEVLNDWGVTPYLFPTKEKANIFAREYLGNEILARLDDPDELQRFVSMIDVTYEDDNKIAIDTIFFEDGENYIQITEQDLEVN